MKDSEPFGDVSSSKNQSGSSRSVPSGKTKKTQTEQVTYLSALNLGMPVDIQEEEISNQTKPVYIVLFSMFAIVDS